MLSHPLALFYVLSRLAEKLVILFHCHLLTSRISAPFFYFQCVQADLAGDVKDINSYVPTSSRVIIIFV